MYLDFSRSLRRRIKPHFNNIRRNFVLKGLVDTTFSIAKWWNTDTDNKADEEAEADEHEELEDDRGRNGKDNNDQFGLRLGVGSDADDNSYEHEHDHDHEREHMDSELASNIESLAADGVDGVGAGE